MVLQDPSVAANSGTGMHTCRYSWRLRVCDAHRRAMAVPWPGQEPVEQMIAAGANVDGGDGAALRAASANGHPEIVRVLLNASADPDELEVLLAACGRGHLSVVQVLLEHGVDLHAGHDAALREACARGHANIVQLLLQHGAVKPSVSRVTHPSSSYDKH